MPFPPRTIIPLWSNSSGSRGIDWPEFRALVSEASGIGTRLQESRPAGAPLPLVTGTAVSVTDGPITLTPGYWRIGACVSFSMVAATSINTLTVAYNMSPSLVGTLPARGVPVVSNSQLRFRQELASVAGGVTGNSELGMYTLPAVRVPVIDQGDFYLVAHATFTVDALSVYGSIWAEYEGAVPA